MTFRMIHVLTSQRLFVMASASIKLTPVVLIAVGLVCQACDRGENLIGNVKLVLTRSSGSMTSPYVPEWFLVSGSDVYHLTFKPESEVVGCPLVTGWDDDGYIEKIGPKFVLVHSEATYRLSGQTTEPRVPLTTRPTKELEVAAIECVTGGGGPSQANMGWRGENGILVNDSPIQTRVEKLNPVLKGGAPIDINSVAPWAAASS